MGHGGRTQDTERQQGSPCRSDDNRITFLQDPLEHLHYISQTAFLRCNSHITKFAQLRVQCGDF